MEYFKNFLESSTVHGLSHIATGRKYVRLFWILVVITGFTGAVILIYTSFQSWADSPVKTTIETLPITEISFPKVTVCPPKNTYTNLNYDLMMAENMTLDNDTRNGLINYASELLYDQLHNDTMRNLSKLVDTDRYYNWYHGYTKVELPSYGYLCDRDYYKVSTCATSGTISTQYFGEEFDADKVYIDLWYVIHVYPPASVKMKSNVTLHIEIENVSLDDLSSGQDILQVQKTKVKKSHQIYNYPSPSLTTEDEYKIQLDRQKILQADVRKQKLSSMPGFRATWHYSGMEVKPEAKCKSHTNVFIRNP